ncbi:TPA: Arc family DNA-binding protein [Enterobacter cloacae]|nr:Arc family DNA-binding protein [Enterobacter cloacae]
MSDKQVKDYDKFVVRFPEGMRESIAERAKRNGRSMNSEIVQVLQDALNSEPGSQDLEGISFIHADDSGVQYFNDPDSIAKYIEQKTDAFKKSMIDDLKHFKKPT